MEESYKKSNIYTKTGDKGYTSLYNGERRPKNSLIFDVLGTLDEISSAIGSCYVEMELYFNKYSNKDIPEEYHETTRILEWVQSRLLDLGSHIATPISSSSSSEKKLEQTKFEEENTKRLEHMIDKYDSELPRLKNFILPKGSLHMARSFCRRAERGMVELLNEGGISQEAFVFMNRLSDFLFVMARYVSQVLFCEKEIIYKK
jgi:cob(I)alamin adenosyltransferase